MDFENHLRRRTLLCFGRRDATSIGLHRGGSMTRHRLLPFTLVAVIVAFGAAYGLVLDVQAQASQASTKPTPHLPDGRPDLNGTWEHGAGISFVRTQRLPDGSVCVIDCPQEPGAARGNFPGAGA